MSRFDYIKYDDQSVRQQNIAKRMVEELEEFIEKIHPTPKTSRAKALAITQLEQVYMWIGKAIRDEQLTLRSGVVDESRAPAMKDFTRAPLSRYSLPE